ncbi:hypothetical protein AB0H92_10815 [Streptomyces phaeochromogenes]|uniref:hypothetical protein n=1 Tax=Streptomyces phaeochromogenes TaxID=1923 RepID=UPI0033D030F5
MSEKNAEAAPLPIPTRVPRGQEIEFDRTGLRLTLQWNDRRQVTQVLEHRDLPDGGRAILAIVDWPMPTIRMVWVLWNPRRMGLLYTGRSVRAAAEAEPCEGDAYAIAVGEMTDCFTGEPEVFHPHRDVEVHAGGRWHPGRMRTRFPGPQGQAVVRVDVSFWEPDWGAEVGFERLYRWDPGAIRPRGTDLPEPS